jgi:hemolysin activation/secretion protein
MQRKVFLIILFTIFCCSLLYAQPPGGEVKIDQATREVDRFESEQKDKLEKTLRKPPKGEPTQEKPQKKAPVAEGQKIFIKKINLVGCETVSAEEFSKFLAKNENKELTLNDLEVLAKEIEREYLEKGVIAAVFIPPQDIKDNTITLQVVESRMGKLYVQDAKYFSKSRLYRYWKTKEGEHLRYDRMYQNLQMMNRNPDREVRAALRAGEAPKTTDVILTPDTNFPLHFTSSYDKEGTVSTGKSRTGLGLRHNNFLFQDDMLLTGYMFGTDFDGIYAYHSLPISYSGTYLLYGYSHSEAKPKKDYTIFDINSDVTTVSVSLHQDLYHKAKYIGEAFVGFDAKDKTVKLNTNPETIGSSSDPYNRDRLRIFSIGGTYIKRRFGSTTTISPTFSQGVSAFGASPMDNPLASRGAKSSFSKFSLSIQHRMLLPLSYQLNFRLKGQVTPHKLTPQEEFGVGGIDSVRGFPASDYLADDAVTTSLEILIPAAFIPKKWILPYEKTSLRDSVTPLIFLDYGFGERHKALETEDRNVGYLSVGPGLRFRLYDQAILRLEWGFPLKGRPITESGHSRFHFAVDFQDKLPEEIERISKLKENKKIKEEAYRLIDRELARRDSPVKEKINQYFIEAASYEKEGKLQEAKESYEKALLLARSLYEQAEAYIDTCLEQEKVLAEYDQQASQYYKQGKYQEAKELWEKIAQGTKEPDFIVEF